VESECCRYCYGCSIVVLITSIFLFQIPVNDDKDADTDVVVAAVAMGCRAGREEVGLCLVSMMAVRSLYFRNHSSHLRRLISSVETYSAAAIE